MSSRMPGVVAAGMGGMPLRAGPATGTPFAVPSPLGANGAVIRVQDARELPPRQHAALVEAIQQELRQQGFDPGPADGVFGGKTRRSEEHTSELQSLMRISYAVFCLKKKRCTVNKSIIQN